MAFSVGIEGLRDDGFEGSQDEHRIFNEVFFLEKIMAVQARGALLLDSLTLNVSAPTMRIPHFVLTVKTLM